MKVLYDLINRVKRLKEGRLFKVVFSDSEVQNIVVQLNTENQLRFGILSNGELLPNYSQTSVTQYGKPAGPIKLFDTGEFYESFKIVQVSEDELSIYADSLKEDTDLVVRYGIEILGLTEENMSILKRRIINQVRNEVRTEILG